MIVLLLDGDDVNLLTLFGLILLSFLVAASGLALSALAALLLDAWFGADLDERPEGDLPVTAAGGVDLVASTDRRGAADLIRSLSVQGLPPPLICQVLSDFGWRDAAIALSEYIMLSGSAVAFASWLAEQPDGRPLETPDPRQLELS